MSTQLNENTNELQSILEAVSALPEGYGTCTVVLNGDGIDFGDIAYQAVNNGELSAGTALVGSHSTNATLNNVLCGGLLVVLDELYQTPNLSVSDIQVSDGITLLGVYGSDGSSSFARFAVNLSPGETGTITFSYSG